MAAVARCRWRKRRKRGANRTWPGRPSAPPRRTIACEEAARIAGQAQGGEILVSSLLKELTESAGDIAFGDGREVELKGLAGTHQVHQIQWK